MYLLVDLYDGSNRLLEEAEAKIWMMDARKVRKTKAGKEAWLGEENLLIKLED